MTWRKFFLVIGACGILLPTLARADWATLSDARGATVQYPRDIFTVAGGEGEPRGRVLGSADARARLHVFTLSNERGESPAQFIRRVVTDRRERLTYQRVARNFFVFSAPESGLILYRRCNFSSEAMIHCVDIRYPQSEKRAWDDPVTRISLSLRPR